MCCSDWARSVGLWACACVSNDCNQSMWNYDGSMISVFSSAVPCRLLEVYCVQRKIVRATHSCSSKQVVKSAIAQPPVSTEFVVCYTIYNFYTPDYLVFSNNGQSFRGSGCRFNDHDLSVGSFLLSGRRGDRFLVYVVQDWVRACPIKNVTDSYVKNSTTFF